MSITSGSCFSCSLAQAFNSMLSIRKMLEASICPTWSIFQNAYYRCLKVLLNWIVISVFSVENRCSFALFCILLHSQRVKYAWSLVYEKQRDQNLIFPLCLSMFVYPQCKCKHLSVCVAFSWKLNMQARVVWSYDTLKDKCIYIAVTYLICILK